jgi:hypothetical protein
MVTTAPRLGLGSTQPPIHWVTGALSRGVKRPGREEEHSSPSSADVKNGGATYLKLPMRHHVMVLN